MAHLWSFLSFIVSCRAALNGGSTILGTPWLMDEVSKQKISGRSGKLKPEKWNYFTTSMQKHWEKCNLAITCNIALSDQTHPEGLKSVFPGGVEALISQSLSLWVSDPLCRTGLTMEDIDLEQQEPFPVDRDGRRVREGPDEPDSKRKMGCCEKFQHSVSRWMLPEDARSKYLERANCCPPPIFIILISIAEVQ